LLGYCGKCHGIVTAQVARKSIAFPTVKNG
jgi:hypothetical protein